MDFPLFIARLILGLGLAAHGAQKLFGWLGGYGIKGTGGFFESLGFFPGPLFALAAGLGELGSGLLTAVGLLSPVGPGLIIVVIAGRDPQRALESWLLRRQQGHGTPADVRNRGLRTCLHGTG
jgi:hypothetical protein